MPESPEVCDDGNQIDGDGCDANCTLTGCGNRVQTTGEQCDDGNTTAGDCCSPTCQHETSAACEVYVGSPYEGSSAAVRVFLRSQSGNAAPLRVISGPTSRLATTGSGGIAVDALHDEIIVAGNFGATKEILVFDRLANGDVAPLRTIAGASTGIVDAQAVAVDPAHDELFLVDYSGQAVRVFSRTASGNVAPIRVLSGAATGLVDPSAMAVDPEADQIYVANYVAGNILVFPRAASGNVAPLRTIAGASTLLNRPNGLALDLINDEIIAGNFHGQRVTVYSLSASGNVSPLRTISGGGSGIASTTGVGVDPVRGELFSANFDTHSLVVHSRTASGAAAPLRSLNGAATGLFRPNPLAVPRSYAGNGVLEPGEQCDDGNTVGGDCCSAAGQFESNGSACTDDGNVCTNDECNGLGTCVHPAGNAGTECRAAAGICDLAEHCDGSSSNCPADIFQPSSVVCRAAAGICDLAEHCEGSSSNCPADIFQPSSVVCRAAAGICDLAERCDGSSTNCPANIFQPSSVVCRATAGICDLAESCNGANPLCPYDIKSSGVCRPAVGPCDAAESCDGWIDDCPSDAPAPDGTACDDGDGCPADTCQGGSCQAVSCPVVDAVVLAGKPLHVNVAAGKTTINKTLSITVRNADVVDRRIALAVDDSHCPPGLAGSPDFDPSTPAADGSVVVPAGKTKKAKLPILVQSADFESFNFKAAQRCVLHIEANAVVVGGSNDPMPNNNRARIEISVVDRNDAEQTFLHETTLNSTKPASLSIRAGMTTASKVVTASIGNADYKPVAENPGDAVTLNASTTCTGLSLSAPLCDVPANSATATVKGGARKACKLTVTADASQISTTNVRSPQRCTVTLSAAGPSQPDPEPSNNLTELVLDVLDKND